MDVPNLNNNGHESKTRKVLFNEVAFFLGLAGTVIGVFMFLTSPQQRSDTAIELLRQQLEQNQKTVESLIGTQKNDFHTLQKTIDEVRAEQQKLQESVIKLNTIIEERIPKK